MVRLTDFQLKKLSEFFLNFSQIVLASLVLKVFEPGVKVIFDRLRWIVLSSGGLVSLSFFILGMFVASKVKEDK